MASINLYGYQVTHYENLQNMLNMSAFALDLSPLGSGKTYTSAKVYATGNYKHLISIAPLSVLTKWNEISETHDIRNIHTISYCSLRTVKGKQPKCNLLRRTDTVQTIVHTDEDGKESEHNIEKITFEVTDKFLDMVREGVLIVIDEIQNIKNHSAQFLACQELIRCILEYYEKSLEAADGTPEKQWGNSRVLLLSGSPVDKRVQVIQLYKTLGILTYDKLAYINPQNKQMMYKGVLEIESFFRKTYGTEVVDPIRAEYRTLHKNNCEEYCYQLFLKVFKKYLTSTMIPPASTYNLTRKNGLFTLLRDPATDEDRKTLMNGVGMLEECARFNPETNSISYGSDAVSTLTQIQIALQMIEKAKRPLFLRLAKEYLTENPTGKLVICCNFTESLDYLADKLSMYKPLRLEGSTNLKNRSKIITSFQEASTEHRLLIGNLQVCSTGIDLDDQHGGFPRKCLVSPNYSTITLYQLSYRFLRANTKSNSSIYFVFCKERQELSVLNCIAKKSNIMKEVTEEQVGMGMVFPGDYEKWEEA